MQDEESKGKAFQFQVQSNFISSTNTSKCDEAQPKCSFCEKRAFKCVYAYKLTTACTSSSTGSENTSNATTPLFSGDESSVEMVLRSFSLTLPSSPSVRLTSSSGNLATNDVRLMHHWSTVTWNTINVTKTADAVLLSHAPKLGFENDFLLHCILGISSLHLEFLNPDSTQIRQQTTLYRIRALSNFQKNFSQVNRTFESWESALLTSILLIVLCSKNYNTYDDELTVISWLTLYRGLASVITMRSYALVETSNSSPIFRRELTPLETVPVIPQILINMIGDIGPLDPDFEYLESYCTTLDSLGILYAGLRQDGLNPNFYVRVISWPSFTSEPFHTCAREKRPRALVILSYYLIFLKMNPGLWWLDGSADAQINAIVRMAGPQYFEVLQVPLQATFIRSAEELESLVLG